MTSCYIDASALIKCYVEEMGSQVMLSERMRRSDWFTSRLSQAECTAALNRLRRDGVLTPQQADAAIREMIEDLERLHVVDVVAPVLARAAEWARRETLRGAGLVHASTALWLRDETVVGAFWCADRRLGNAVAVLGLPVFDPAALATTP